MAAPPLSTGFFHSTNVCRLKSAVASKFVGAPGTVRGVIAREASDAAPVPMLFTAATVNV